MEHTYREYGMTEREYIEFLLSLPLTSHLVPLVGYTDPDGDEDTAKIPIRGFKWRNPEEWKAFAPNAVSHLQRGGWLAIAVKKGYTVIDIDEVDAKQKALEVYGDTFAVTTRRGVHLYYAGERYDLTGRKPCLVFKATDFQNSNRYIVAPFADEHRIWNGVKEIQQMPIEFTLSPTAEVQKLFNEDNALYYLKEGDGRNNLLYSIGRKLRLYAEQHEDVPDSVVEEAMYRIANLFHDPLSEKEVAELVRSVYSNGHREDFVPDWNTDNGKSEGDGEQFFQGDTNEVNPFTVFVPLSQFSEKKRDEVVKGLCREGDIVLLCGAPKGGKSTFLRSLAISATTHSTPPLPVLRKGKVWWYVLEEHPSDIIEVIRNSGYECDTDSILISYADTNKLRDPLSAFIAGIRQMLATAEEPPVFIFVDTVGRLMNDFDINDYTKVQRTIETIRWAIRDFENPPVIVLVHHTNKGGERGVSPLGSQAFSGSSDTIIMLTASEEGVSMLATGRNVCPSFAMQTVPLTFKNGIYVGIGHTIDTELAKLVKKIHRHEITTIEDALDYQGGVFKSDIRRLLRKGILIGRNGNVYTNEYNKSLEVYLNVAEEAEYIPPKGVSRDVTKREPKNTLNAVAGDVSGVVGIKCAIAGETATAETATTETATAVIHADDKRRNGDDRSAGVANERRSAGIERRNGSGIGTAEGDEVYPHENISGQKLTGDDTGSGYVGHTATGEDDSELTPAERDIRRSLKYHAENVAKRAEETKNMRINVTELGETEMAEIQNDFKRITGATPISAEEAQSRGWELVRENILPPILQKVALVALSVGVKPTLYPSDFDPFCGDLVIDMETHPVYKKLLDAVEAHNVKPEMLGEHIAKHVWQTERLTIQEALSLHVALLKRYKKFGGYFVAKLPFLSGWFLVYTDSAQKFHMVAITDEEAQDPEMWRKIYWFVLRGGVVPMRKQYAELEKLLRRGISFTLYKTPEGKKVYVLNKHRTEINTEKDFYAHLCRLLDMNIPAHLADTERVI